MRDHGLSLVFVLVGVFVVLGIALLLQNIDEETPWERMANTELEVVDVVLAENLWRSGSYVTGSGPGRTTVALHVRVTNKNPDPLPTAQFSFTMVTEEGDRIMFNFNDIVDPRLVGGPFHVMDESVQGHGTRLGWIGVMVDTARLTWTDADLVIPTRAGGPEPTTAHFTIAGARFLEGLPPRIEMTAERIKYTNVIGSETPFDGRAFFIFDLTFTNLWMAPYTLNPLDLTLSYSHGGGFFCWHVGGDWDLEDPFGEVVLAPLEERTMQAVFDRGSPESLVFIRYIDRTRGSAPISMNITIPIGLPMIEAGFSPSRAEIEVERIQLRDEVEGRRCNEGNAFLIVRASLTFRGKGDLRVRYANLSLLDSEGVAHGISPVSEHLPNLMEERHLKSNMTVHGDLAFEAPEGTEPGWLVYTDYGQMCRGTVDPLDVVDTREWPMLDIRVVNLTSTDWLDDRYNVDEGEYILLVMINVSHRWDQTQRFELDNLTLFDANGTRVGDDVYNLWSPDHLRGSASLAEGEWEAGQFHIRVANEWEPGTLVYANPDGDIVIDIRGMDVTPA
jgi:hypothetical protein